MSGDGKLGEIEIQIVIDVTLEQWLEAARDGSVESLGRALEAFRPYLAQKAARELGADLQSKEGVSDLVQETFVGACRDFRSFAGRTVPEWKEWLQRILINKVKQVGRRYRGAGKRKLGREVPLEQVLAQGRPDAGLVDETLSPSGFAMESERAERFARAIARLSGRDREILALRLHEECTFEEIGRRLACSPVAARNRWVRAAERLRRELQSSRA